MTDIPLSITLQDGPLPAATPWACDGAGAVVTFEGVVRRGEPDADGTVRELAALLYEAYEPMTTRELRRLAASLGTEHGLLAAAVEHSVGAVPVGGCSFRLRAAGRHRAETLAFVAAFIDRMKRDVPLWKVPRWT